MIAVEHRGSGQRSKSLAQLERDAALSRVGRARRWLIVAAAALTAGLAALVSAIAPGRTLGARAQVRVPVTNGSVRSASATQMPPLASPSTLGLRGPSVGPQAAPSQSGPSQAAPAPASAAPAPVSGGS
jgi:hypothetical protein